MAKIERLYLIPILSKALDVLELLDASKAPVALEEIYARTRISKTSVYRILKTLVHRGYVAQARNGRYRLVSRPRRLQFGFAAAGAETPFATAVIESAAAAAAASGVELPILDDRNDSEAAIRNAGEFAAKQVDLAFAFRIDESTGSRIARIFKQAGIPVIAIDIPLPNATYLGVDTFEAGFDAGCMLAEYALRRWNGKADWVLGVGFPAAGIFFQSRIRGAFDGIRDRLAEIPEARFLSLDGRGARQPSQMATADFLRNHRDDERILVAAANDLSALGVLDAARLFGREQDFAIAGLDSMPDAVPEAIEEIRAGKSALIGSISCEPASYGPRLIQLGIALLRGFAVPAYNYVRHKAVTPETLGAAKLV